LKEKLNNPNIKIKSVDITGMSSYIPTNLTPEIRTYLKGKNIDVPADDKDDKNDYLAKARALVCEDWLNAKIKESTNPYYTTNKVEITKNYATGVT
jgi:hypothetical protein